MALLPRKLKLEKRKEWVDVVSDLRVRITVVIILCVFIGIGIPVFVTKLMLNEKKAIDLEKRCQFEHELRIDCLPGLEHASQNRERCEEVGCCWSVFGETVPSCYHSHPTNYTYRLSSKDNDLDLSPNFNITPLGVLALEEIKFKIVSLSENHLRMSIFKDSDFESMDLFDYKKATFSNLTTEASCDVFIGRYPHFYIQVRRKSSNSIPLFNTYYGPLIFSEGFAEITTLLPSFNIYGIGQAPKNSFRHDLKYANRFALFGRTESNNETHPEMHMVAGVHPFYMVVENDGNAHGVLLLSSSPVEIVTSGAPSVTFRTSESLLDFHLFLGPSPGDVVRQLTEFVGRSSMPPYWALGYHSCRDTPDLCDAVRYLNYTKSKGIPHESDCGTSQLLSSAFAINKSLRLSFKKFYDLLKSSDRQLLLVQYPHIEENNVFAKSADTQNSSISDLSRFCVTDGVTGKLFKGYLPNGIEVAYPDFFSIREILPWLKTNYQILMRNIKFDGLILNSNTPVNFNITASKENRCGKFYSTFSPLGYNLNAGTICADALHVNNQPHVKLHNLYGYKQALAVISSIQKLVRFKNSRKFISSLSTFTGSGALNSHWGGLVPASWESMKNSLIQMLDFSLYGIPLNGVPVCGTSDILDVDLCSRWLQLAAFQPLILSYRVDGEELLGKNRRLTTVAASMIQLRYSLLPYMYTLFYRARQYGDTVVRPLFFEFPAVAEALKADEQFMWGGALLVSPVLTPATQKINAFFPPVCWYDYYTGRRVAKSKAGTYKELMAIEYHVNLHIRGGHVIPSQEANLTTKSSRQNSFTLTIALDCSKNRNYGDIFNDPERVLAYGELYIDDGESEDSIEKEDFLLVNVTVRGRYLGIVPKVNGRKLLQKDPVSTSLESIHIYGFSETPSNFFVNGLMYDYVFKPTLGIVSLRGLNLDLNTEHDIVWLPEQ